MAEAPHIETEQLVLTWPTAAQIDGYHAAIVGTSMFDTILWDGPQDAQELHQWWAHHRTTAGTDEAQFTVAAIERSTGDYVGGLGLRPVEGDRQILDLGYAFAPRVHGRGYGSASVAALVHHGFAELGAERIFAQVFVGNHASRRVAEKAGLRLEGTLRRTVCKRGEWKDEWLLAMTRPDWESQQP